MSTTIGSSCKQLVALPTTWPCIRKRALRDSVRELRGALLVGHVQLFAGYSFTIIYQTVILRASSSIGSRRPSACLRGSQKHCSLGRNAYGDYVPGAMIGNVLNNITISSPNQRFQP